MGAAIFEPTLTSVRVMAAISGCEGGRVRVVLVD